MLPEGWEIIHLGDCLSMLRSGLSRNLSSEDIGVPVIRSGNMTDEYINFEELKYWHIDDPQGSDTSNYILDDGDLLISFINSQAQIGKTSIFFNKINRPCIYTTNILRAKPSANLDLRYFFYVTKTKDYDDYIQSITKPAVNQASFTTKDFQKYKFQLPPLPEQKKIARILSTWDNAILATERLLENSQQRKKALMQQLLTGKKRLPGFEGEWVKKRLIDVVKIETGSSKSASVNDNGTNFIIDMGSVTRSGRLVPTKRTSLDGPYLVTGQLVMPKDDIGGGNIIGRVGVIPEDNKYILADHVYALTPLGGIDSHFLGYLINSDVVNKSLRRKANGTAQLGLGRKDVERQDILIPSDIREQKSIGQIILLNDQENELLQKRLDHLRLEKKALMQQLLTGKRRVLVDTAA